jgi:VWFA-related protein
MSPARFALLISLLTPASLPLPAQQQPAAAAPNSSTDIPTLHVTSRLVVLDVVVTDNSGAPVKGLKPSDFTLTEDGVKEKFASFTEHDATTDLPLIEPTPTLPPNTFTVHAPVSEAKTKTIIVLDKIHYPNDPYVREDILKFMKTLAPGNPIAIIRLDWLGLHLVEDFTSDPQALQETVASKRMLPPLPSIMCSRGPNPYRQLARYIAGIPGRINLAWVTDEGRPDGPLNTFEGDYPQLANFVGNQYGATDDMRLSRVVPYLIKVGGYIGGILQPLSHPDNVAPLGFPESLSELPPDCEIMPAAKGGLLDNGILADKAIELGGHAFFNGATDALSQIIATGADYYTLSYVPTNPNWNGALRKIGINVTGIPQTVQSAFGAKDYGQSNITYRRGYYARSTPDPRPGTAGPAFASDATSPPSAKLVSISSPGADPHSTASMAAAMGLGAPTPNLLDVTIAVAPSPQIEAPKPGIPLPKDNFLAGPFRDAPYRNFRVHYWIDARNLKFSRTASGSFRDDLQFAAILYRDDGLVANTVSITTHIQAPADRLEDILTSGVTFDQTIAIPVSGNFFLRTGVQEVSTDRIGIVEVPTEAIKLPPHAPH